jgi:hypothetical protein
MVTMESKVESADKITQIYGHYTVTNINLLIIGVSPERGFRVLKKSVLRLFFSLITAFFFATAGASAIAASQTPYTYAVVISKSAYADAGWKAVADTLLKRHSATASRLFTWTSSVTECKTDLAGFMPTYIGFIARPATECNAAFIAAASQLTRDLDSDPYGDAYWGVITGFEAADALRAVTESLTVKTVVLGANNLAYEPPLERFYQAVGMTCDSYTKTDYIFPGTSGKVYTASSHPDNEQDRVKPVCKWLNAGNVGISVSGKGSIEGPIDCLVTGGHGNVNVWQCHYSDATGEGYVMSKNGQLYGQPNSGSDININAPKPLIYWCASNCRMGGADDKNNFVYAAFHTGHAVQMFGFIPDAASGDDFMSWGIYDRLTKFAGRYTLPQSFFIALNNSIFELRHSTNQFDEAGVKSYLNATAMYGDPAANVTFYDFGDSAKSYKENFSSTPGTNGNIVFEYTVTTKAHGLDFGSGYCYAFRPVFFMPGRVDPATVSITKNDGHTAEITDNLILWELLAKGETLAKGASKTLRFSAKLLSGTRVGPAASVNSPTPRASVFASGAGGNKGIVLQFRDLPAGKIDITFVDASGKIILKAYDRHSGGNGRSEVFPQSVTVGMRFVTVRCGGVCLKEKIAFVNE